MIQSNNNIVRSLNNLIEYSTDFRFKRRANFKQLHTAIIKNHFNASSVVLDIEKGTVLLGIDMLERGAEVEITFNSLEKFLKSCIRETEENISFYKNILHYYAMTEAVA